MQKFKGKGLIEAKFKNKIIECRTTLTAYGWYREWFEPSPVEWMYGWTETEQEIDTDSIELDNPDEWEYEDGEAGNGTLDDFVKELDVEWELDLI